jgi:hypothetical protein
LQVGPRAGFLGPAPERPDPVDEVSGPRRLSVPRRVLVHAVEDGRPGLVGGREVDAVRESWLIEDRWWTDRPLRRRYWEVVTTCGRDEVVFLDLESGRWWRQR